MDTYIDMSNAKSICPEIILNKLVSSGNIRSIMVTGNVMLNETDVRASIPLRMRSEYIQYSDLIGVRISIADAQKKYNLIHSTISRWCSAGIISVLGYDGRKTMIDEADVATVAYILSLIHI